MQRLAFFLTCSLLLAGIGQAQEQTSANKEAKIQSATSAAPPSISADARVMDWPEKPGGEKAVLREGSNNWTCLPDMPQTKGEDPMCLDEPWMEWLEAFENESEPSISEMGFGYMLRGSGAGVSNTDPYAEGPTPDNEWMETSVPHLMIVVPSEKMLSGLPTDPENGGPWVMWRDTPLAHIMVPMPRYEPEKTTSATSNQ